MAGIGLNRGRFFIGPGENVNLTITTHVNLIFEKEAKMETSDLGIENLIQGFRLSCQTEGKSAKTIDWYSDFLNGFRKFLSFKRFPVDLDQINREHKPALLGISSLLTTTMIGMKDVINALTEAGLRDKIKVIVGGAPVNQDFASQIGADYYSRDAGSAATLLEKIVAEIKDK